MNMQVMDLEWMLAEYDRLARRTRKRNAWLRDHGLEAR